MSEHCSRLVFFEFGKERFFTSGSRRTAITAHREPQQTDARRRHLNGTKELQTSGGKTFSADKRHQIRAALRFRSEVSKADLEGKRSTDKAIFISALFKFDRNLIECRRKTIGVLQVIGKSFFAAHTLTFSKRPHWPQINAAGKLIEDGSGSAKLVSQAAKGELPQLPAIRYADSAKALGRCRSNAPEGFNRQGINEALRPSG